MIKITKKLIEENFGQTIAERGYGYYKQSNVTNILISGNKISATVLGSDDYTTEVEIKGNQVLLDCDCPYDRGKCKHGAAVLYTVMHKKIKEPRYKELLSKKSKEELLELLLFVLKEEPKLASRINLREVKLKDDVKAIFSKYEWNEGRYALKELKSIMRGIEFSQKDNHSEKLIEDMKESIKILSNGLNIFNDINSIYGDFLSKWISCYMQLFKTSELSKKKGESKKFILELLEWGLKDDFGLENCYYDTLVKFIEKKDLDFIKKVVIDKIETVKDKYDKEEIVYLLLDIYNKFQLNEKFIELAEQYGQTDRLVKKLIEFKRLDRALELCNKKLSNLNKDDYPKKHYFLELRSEILLKKGDEKSAIENLYKTIELDPSEKTIKQLKEHCIKNNCWDKWKEKLMNMFYNYEDNYFFIKFCLDEKEYIKAYDTAKTMSNEHPYLVEKTAKSIEKKYPEKASHLYKLIAEHIISYGAGGSVEMLINKG